MTIYQQFKRECAEEIAIQGADPELAHTSLEWMSLANARKYSYHFEWLGRPIIQYPQDIVAMQEIIWAVQPDLIIETGIAHGGSLIFFASMLELIGGDGHVLGIDIDIRKHNRDEIEKHRMFKRITMIEGSSIAPDIAAKVCAYAAEKSRVLLVLDSNHTHEHVLEELRLYSSLVKQGSYIVVFDTVIEDLPADAFPDRPWGKGNNPKTAVREFLKTNDRFTIDSSIEKKLLITVAPEGYLK